MVHLVLRATLAVTVILASAYSLIGVMSNPQFSMICILSGIGFLSGFRAGGRNPSWVEWSITAVLGCLLALLFLAPGLSYFFPPFVAGLALPIGGWGLGFSISGIRMRKRSHDGLAI